MVDWNAPGPIDRRIGMAKQDLETPCLCLELDRFEANLKMIADRVAGAGKVWRPHAKCHKTPHIAVLAMEQGAIGVTCSKVSEAEVMLASGIRDILVAHLPVGTRRISRLVELGSASSLIVTCDHYVQAASLSAECQRNRVTCRVLVEVNLGMDRTGVRPGRDTIELARGIEQLPGLNLAGLTGNDEHVKQIHGPADRQKSIESAFGLLSHSKDLLLNNGLCCDIVSAGGSASVGQAIQCSALTEIQAGAVIFGDPFYSSEFDQSGFQPALSVTSTIVSRSAYNRAVLDAGRTSFSNDVHAAILEDWSDARISWMSEEHSVLELGPESRELRIGDRISLRVGYSGLTTMLHEEMICLRNGHVESVWPMTARGKLV